jgi:uncharacterized protein (TIGR02246 family)
VAAPLSESSLARALNAADRLDIMQVGASFDNALDAEDAAKFVSVFTGDGVLAGFWGKSNGPAQIEQAFHFMLRTFAKNRRHCVSNQEIEVTGDSASMFSYLTVHDQKTNTSIGTANFRDELIRDQGSWKFTRRTLNADPNVTPIIQAIQSKS